MEGNWKENCYTLMQEGHLRYILEKFYNPKRIIPNILELGCGFGRITDIILDNWVVAQYTAVDISPEQLKHVKERHPEVNVVCADITTLPVNAWKNFHLVIGVEFLMHIKPKDLTHVFTIMNHASDKHVVTMDYYPEKKPTRTLSIHNFLHDYPTLYEKITEKKPHFERIYDQQGIFWK